MRRTAHALLAVAARIVPRSMRREFRLEWEAELASDQAAVPAARTQLLRRAAGSIPDAVYLFRQRWSLDMLRQDVRYAWRVLTRRPSYPLLVITILALAIGATTTMFSAIDAVLLRPLPYPSADRLVQIWENDRVNQKPRYFVAPANWNDWRTGNQTFDAVAAYLDSGGSLTIGAEPVRISVPAVTTDLFRLLGAQPMLGRVFEEADGVPPRHRVLVLSYATWRDRFGSDPTVIDRTLPYNGVPYRIIGVAEPRFRFPTSEAVAWRPLAFSPEALATRAQHFLNVIGMLKPGVTLAEAHADLEKIAVTAQKAYPTTNDQRGTTVLSLRDAIAGEVRRPMLLLGVAVCLLLLIGAVNVANLMLVEATGRRREIAVRTALGADRLRIVRQLVAEGLLLAAGGGIAGVLLATYGVKVLGTAASEYVPGIDGIAIDGRVLLFATVVSLVTGVLFALAPALAASRSDVQKELREGGRGTVGGGNRLRGAFVTLEVAAAVVLMVGGAMVIRSFVNVLRIEPGFNTGVMTASTDMPARYNSPAPINQFYNQVLTRLRQRPDVQAAGAVNNLPLSGSGWTSWLTIEHAPKWPGEPPEVGYRVASAGYFEAVGVPLLQGRTIKETDGLGNEVIVINQALAERYFPNGDAIGRRIRLGPRPTAPWKTIVGVVGNVRHRGLESEVTPEAFVPAGQDGIGNLSIAVRGTGSTAALASAMREAVRAADPAVTVWKVQSLESMLDEYLAPRRLSMLLVLSLAGVAVTLALLGIYGVLSYTVTQRRSEFGVRLALGASPGGILKRTLRDGLSLALPGILLGTVAGVLASRAARATLFNVSPVDPAAYAAVIGASVAVVMMASYVPARRAARVDPLSAIRNE